MRDVHADNEFECVRDTIETIHAEDDFRDLRSAICLEVCTTNEHVRKVERSIRTMKEVIRATVHGMPYKRLPKQMIS